MRVAWEACPAPRAMAHGGTRDLKTVDVPSTSLKNKLESGGGTWAGFRQSHWLGRYSPRQNPFLDVRRTCTWRNYRLKLGRQVLRTLPSSLVSSLYARFNVLRGLASLLPNFALKRERPLEDVTA